MSEKPNPKHRVIEWNPAAHQGNASAKKSGRNKLFAAIAVVSLLVALVAVGLSWQAMHAPVAEGSVAAVASEGEKEPAYVSRGRAELAYQNASETLAGVRSLPANHPTLHQELALIEKAFLLAESDINKGNYATAAKSLENVKVQMDAFTETVEMQKNAKKRYDDLYARLRQAERIRSFAPAAYDQAFNSIGEGRLLLEQGSFRAAWQAFDEATTTLDDFESRKKTFVEDNLHAGQIALNQGDETAAVTAFQAALEYDSANEAGLRGLTRAKTIAQVHQLLETGKQAEADQDFDLAIQSYDEAFALDALSAVAQQGSSRAKADQKEALFNGFVADAEAAASDEKWDTVIARYEDALEVYPKRDDIKDALDEAHDKHHEAKVFNTLADAYDLERDFEWDRARVAYEKLLDLEPEHEEAIEGLIRVGRTVRAKLEYEKLIELAQQHIQAADYQTAIRTYNQAMQTKPGYLEISPEIATLRTTLEQNSKPISITFVSDDRTWVSISNYRMLGKIRSETVALPPGDYEVIGRRKKYQDVLLLLKVRPGMTTNQVNVVCNIRADT
jgi:tetratricopeptide (TPR) repeat protein